MSMGTFVDRGLLAEDKGHLKMLSLELVADEALGFNFFEGDLRAGGRQLLPSAAHANHPGRLKEVHTMAQFNHQYFTKLALHPRWPFHVLSHNVFSACVISTDTSCGISNCVCAISFYNTAISSNTDY